MVVKDKGIDYLFIFIILRIFHFLIFYIKIFLDILLTHPKFDKSQILWWFPFLQNEIVQNMNANEFRYFILGYLDKVERELLTNKKTHENYRLFIDDVIYNFDWNLCDKNLQFEKKHVTEKYSFESDLHYLTDIIEKLHLPFSQVKLRDNCKYIIETFDSYTEAPQLNNLQFSEAFYKIYSYVQNEFISIASNTFSKIGPMLGQWTNFVQTKQN